MSGNEKTQKKTKFLWCNKCQKVVEHRINGMFNYTCTRCGEETDRTPLPEFNDRNHTLLWYRNLHNEEV